MPLTPNMLLQLPVIGTTLDPTWSQEFLNDLNIIDGHNHTIGSGIQLASASLAIVTNFNFNSHAAISVGSLQFNVKGVPLTSTIDIGKLYSVSDLYYNNYSGQQVQITSGSTVNIGGTGGFKGDYSIDGAIASFNNSENRFIYTNAGSIFSEMQGSSVIYTNTGGFTVSLFPAPITPSNFVITLPLQLPGSTQILVLDATGLLSTEAQVPTAQFATSGVQASSIANTTITAAQIANNSLIGTSFANQGVSALNLVALVDATDSINTNVSTTNSTNTPTGYSVTLSGLFPGRPTLIYLQSQSNPPGDIVITQPFNNNIGTGHYILFRDGVPIFQETIMFNSGDPNQATPLMFPSNAIKFLDTTTNSATHNYTLEFRVDPNTFNPSFPPTIAISPATLIGYQL